MADDYRALAADVLKGCGVHPLGLIGAIDAVAQFAKERVIEELERLAKVRCEWCEDSPAVLGKTNYIHHLPKGSSDFDTEMCHAQPEQRRIAELKAELEKSQCPSLIPSKP